MRTMFNLVGDIVELNDRELQLLPDALVLYSNTKAERLEFLLNVMQKERSGYELENS